MNIERKRILLAIGLIVVVTAVAYAPAVQNGFTNWDDNHMVTHNGMIRNLSLGAVAQIFSSMHYSHYHPLVVLSFAVEFHFFQLDPWIYHFTNVLFHVINSVLVFWFVRSLRGGWAIALIVALLFGVHPLHVESVAWITERKDVLYSFFYLLALIAYIKYIRGKEQKYLLLTGLAFLCSLMSKAMAVTLPVVLLLVDFLLQRKFDRNVFIEKFPFLALSFLFGIIMLYATYPSKSMVASASFGIGNILVAFHGLIFYIWKFLVPLNLSSLYPYPGRLGDPLPLQFTVSPLIVVVVLFVVALTLKKTRFPLFCAAFYLITLAPVLQLTRVGGVIAADRFVYIPLLGLILGLVEAVFWLGRKNAGSTKVIEKGIFAAFVGLVVLLSSLTWHRTQVWKDSVTLWSNVGEQYTGVAVVYNNRGLAYADRQEFGMAMEDYNAGLALESDDWRLLFNRANALRELGAYQDALREYNRSIVQFPTNADIYYYRGLIFQYLGRFDDAVDDYAQAIKLNPGRIEAYVNRGTILAETKKFDEALNDFNVALSMNPNDADVYFNRGLVYRIIGKTVEALGDFSSALSMEPRNAKTLNFRGMTYFQIGEFDKAIGDYERAIDIEPSNPNLYNNRGAALYQKREFDRAIADYTVALSFSPNNYEALTNRAFAYCASEKFDAARKDLAALREMRAWIDPRLIELTAKK